MTCLGVAQLISGRRTDHTSHFAPSLSFGYSAHPINLRLVIEVEIEVASGGARRVVHVVGKSADGLTVGEAIALPRR